MAFLDLNWRRLPDDALSAGAIQSGALGTDDAAFADATRPILVALLQKEQFKEIEKLLTHCDH